MKNWKSAFMIAASVGMLGALSACDREPADGPAERAGEALDNSVDRAGQQMENAGERIQEEARENR